MFEITDSDGEVYKGEGRQWTLAMQEEEECQLLAVLLERAGGMHNLALEDLISSVDDDEEEDESEGDE